MSTKHSGRDIYPCPVEDCKHKPFKSEKGLDNHLKKVHGWDDAKIWEDIKKNYVEAGEPPTPDGSPDTDEAQTLEEGSPPTFDPEAFREQMLNGVIAELEKFAKTMDDRLKPLEEFQGLLDQTLKGKPTQNAQATSNQKPKAQGTGQMGELVSLLKAAGLIEGEKTGLANLAETLTTARLIANAMNPASPWDRVQDSIMIRILSRQGLLTDSEIADLKKDLT